jgi:hypothetical protein
VQVSRASDINVGDEFTYDNGSSWWCASRVEPRPEAQVWVEAQGVGRLHGAVMSQSFMLTHAILRR